jgi:hypothetical protein
LLRTLFLRLVRDGGKNLQRKQKCFCKSLTWNDFCEVLSFFRSVWLFELFFALNFFD